MEPVINTSELANRYRYIDLSDYGSAPADGDELKTTLWFLWVLQEGIGVEPLTAAEIEVLMVECLSVHITRQKIFSSLRNAKGLVLSRKSKGKWRFRILKPGIELVSNSRMQPLFVNPRNAFTGRRSIQEMLAALAGEVRICDPYIDPATMDYISKARHADRIRLLTMQTRRESEFKRDVAAFQAEGGKLEVRKAEDRNLHDRYIIDGQRMYLLGTSLSGLGKKQTIVVELEGDIRTALIREFDEIWKSATAIC